MPMLGFLRLAAGLALLAFSLTAMPHAGALDQADQRSAAVSPERALLNQYCSRCHNDRLKTGGLSFDTVDLQDVAGNTRTLGEGRPQASRAGDAAGRLRRGPTKRGYSGCSRIWRRELDRAAAQPPESRPHRYRSAG